MQIYIIYAITSSQNVGAAIISAEMYRVTYDVTYQKLYLHLGNICKAMRFWVMYILLCYMLTSHAQQSYNPFSVGTATPIPTAPQHIYIQHRDPKGDYYNVELATAGFPRDGTLQTLTHSTSEAIRSGIALRQYDDRQSIGLCMVQLAKSYEHRYHSKDADFLMQCAETVLQYDSLNLNALLLKQQVLDERLMAYCHKTNATHIATLRKDKAINATLTALEQHSDKLYRYGYRQMPIAMQQIILSGSYPSQYSDANPTPFTTIKTQDPKENSYTSLYEGLFQEVFTTQPTEQYGHIVYHTNTKQLCSIDTTAQANELIDPVAFAYDFGARMYDARIGRWMSTDPLEAKFPQWTPYSAFANNPILFVDKKGEEPYLDFVANIETIIRNMKAANVDDIIDAANYFGVYSKTLSENTTVKRQVYTQRVGWIDLKHFFAAAVLYQTFIPIESYVLEQGEQKERDQEASGNLSAWGKEDLQSNLRGLIFAKNFAGFEELFSLDGADFYAAFQSYFEYLEATAPENAPDYNQIPKNEDARKAMMVKNPNNKPIQNKIYTPLDRNPKYNELIDVDKELKKDYEDICSDAQKTAN